MYFTEEKIKELAVLSGFYIEENGNITDGIETSQRLNEELGKFAELIIEEILKEYE